MLTLERELQRTQKQLAASERRVEQAAFERRAARAGAARRSDDDTFGVWD